MAQPTKSTVTVDGTAFDAVSTSVVFSTPVTAPGVAEMGALITSVRVVVDFNDDTNLPFSALNSLFTLSNVVDRTKIKDMKIDFWKDDTKADVLCSYKFKGWISRFETTNHPSSAPGNPLNHMLVMDLQPVINKALFQDIQMTN
jgi:hypothetical protein